MRATNPCRARHRGHVCVKERGHVDHHSCFCQAHDWEVVGSGPQA